MDGVWRFTAVTKYHQRLKWDSLVITGNDDKFILDKDFHQLKKANISFSEHELTLYSGSELVVLPFQCTSDGARVRKVMKMRSGRGRNLAGGSTTMLRVLVNGTEGETGVFVLRADPELRILVAVTLTGAITMPLVGVGGKRAKLSARDLLGDLATGHRSTAKLKWRH